MTVELVEPLSDVPNGARPADTITPEPEWMGAPKG